MPKKIISNTSSFQCCTKSVNTYTCFVQLQLQMPQWVQVCLLRPSVALQAIHVLSSHKQRFPTAGTPPERDLQMVLLLHRRRNNSTAGDMMSYTYSGVPKLYVRVVYSASWMPKSLPSQEPHTHIPGRGDVPQAGHADDSLNFLPRGGSHCKSYCNVGSPPPTAGDAPVSARWGLL